MIIACHGAFDTKRDRECAFSRQCDAIRAAKFSTHDVVELDVDDIIVMVETKSETPAPGTVEVTFVEMMAEPNTEIGYSNGCDNLWTQYLQKLSQAKDANLTSLQTHWIFDDFVWKGLRQIVDRADIPMPSTVHSCLCFYRTKLTGVIPPYHSLIQIPDGPHRDFAETGDAFQEVAIDADHGNLPGDPTLMKMTLNRLKEIYA